MSEKVVPASGMAQVPESPSKSCKQCKINKEKFERKEKVISLLKEYIQVKDKHPLSKAQLAPHHINVLRSKSFEDTVNLKNELSQLVTATKINLQLHSEQKKKIDQLTLSLRDSEAKQGFMQFQLKQLSDCTSEKDAKIKSLEVELKRLTTKSSSCVCGTFSTTRRKRKPKDRPSEDEIQSTASEFPPSVGSSVPEFPRAGPSSGPAVEGILTPASSVASTRIPENECSPGITWDLTSSVGSPLLDNLDNDHRPSTPSHLPTGDEPDSKFCDIFESPDKTPPAEGECEHLENSGKCRSIFEAEEPLNSLPEENSVNNIKFLKESQRLARDLDQTPADPPISREPEVPADPKITPALTEMPSIFDIRSDDSEPDVSCHNNSVDMKKRDAPNKFDAFGTYSCPTSGESDTEDWVVPSCKDSPNRTENSGELQEQGVPSKTRDTQDDDISPLNDFSIPIGSPKRVMPLESFLQTIATETQRNRHQTRQEQSSSPSTKSSPRPASDNSTEDSSEDSTIKSSSVPSDEPVKSSLSTGKAEELETPSRTVNSSVAALNDDVLSPDLRNILDDNSVEPLVSPIKSRQASPVKMPFKQLALNASPRRIKRSSVSPKKRSVSPKKQVRTSRKTPIKKTEAERSYPGGESSLKTLGLLLTDDSEEEDKAVPKVCAERQITSPKNITPPIRAKLSKQCSPLRRKLGIITKERAAVFKPAGHESDSESATVPVLAQKKQPDAVIQELLSDANNIEPNTISENITNCCVLSSPKDPSGLSNQVLHSNNSVPKPESRVNQWKCNPAEETSLDPHSSQESDFFGFSEVSSNSDKSSPVTKSEKSKNVLTPVSENHQKQVFHAFPKCSILTSAAPRLPTSTCSTFASFDTKKFPTFSDLKTSSPNGVSWGPSGSTSSSTPSFSSFTPKGKFSSSWHQHRQQSPFAGRGDHRGYGSEDIVVGQLCWSLQLLDITASTPASADNFTSYRDPGIKVFEIKQEDSPFTAKLLMSKCGELTERGPESNYAMCHSNHPNATVTDFVDLRCQNDCQDKHCCGWTPSERLENRYCPSGPSLPLWTTFGSAGSNSQPFKAERHSISSCCSQWNQSRLPHTFNCRNVVPNHVLLSSHSPHTPQFLHSKVPNHLSEPLCNNANHGFIPAQPVSSISPPLLFKTSSSSFSNTLNQQNHDHTRPSPKTTSNGLILATPKLTNNAKSPQKAVQNKVNSSSPNKIKGLVTLTPRKVVKMGEWNPPSHNAPVSEKKPAKFQHTMETAMTLIKKKYSGSSDRSVSPKKRPPCIVRKSGGTVIIDKSQPEAHQVSGPCELERTKLNVNQPLVDKTPSELPGAMESSSCSQADQETNQVVTVCTTAQVPDLEEDLNTAHSIVAKLPEEAVVLPQVGQRIVDSTSDIQSNGMSHRQLTASSDGLADASGSKNTVTVEVERAPSEKTCLPIPQPVVESKIPLVSGSKVSVLCTQNPSKTVSAVISNRNDNMNDMIPEVVPKKKRIAHSSIKVVSSPLKTPANERDQVLINHGKIFEGFKTPQIPSSLGAPKSAQFAPKTGKAMDVGEVKKKKKTKKKWKKNKKDCPVKPGTSDAAAAPATFKVPADKTVHPCSFCKFAPELCTCQVERMVGEMVDLVAPLSPLSPIRENCESEGSDRGFPEDLDVPSEIVEKEESIFQNEMIVTPVECVAVKLSGGSFSQTNLSESRGDAEVAGSGETPSVLQQDLLHSDSEYCAQGGDLSTLNCIEPTNPAESIEFQDNQKAEVLGVMSGDNGPINSEISPAKSEDFAALGLDISDKEEDASAAALNSTSNQVSAGDKEFPRTEDEGNSVLSNLNPDLTQLPILANITDMEETSWLASTDKVDCNASNENPKENCEFVEVANNKPIDEHSGQVMDSDQSVHETGGAEHSLNSSNDLSRQTTATSEIKNVKLTEGVENIVNGQDSTDDAVVSAVQVSNSREFIAQLSNIDVSAGSSIDKSKEAVNQKPLPCRRARKSSSSSDTSIEDLEPIPKRRRSLRNKCPEQRVLRSRMVAITSNVQKTKAKPEEKTITTENRRGRSKRKTELMDVEKDKSECLIPEDNSRMTTRHSKRLIEQTRSKAENTVETVSVSGANDVVPSTTKQGRKSSRNLSRTKRAVDVAESVPCSGGSAHHDTSHEESTLNNKEAVENTETPDPGTSSSVITRLSPAQPTEPRQSESVDGEESTSDKSSLGRPAKPLGISNTLRDESNVNVERQSSDSECEESISKLSVLKHHPKPVTFSTVPFEEIDDFLSSAEPTVSTCNGELTNVFKPTVENSVEKSTTKPDLAGWMSLRNSLVEEAALLKQKRNSPVKTPDRLNGKRKVPRRPGTSSPEDSSPTVEPNSHSAEVNVSPSLRVVNGHAPDALDRLFENFAGAVEKPCEGISPAPCPSSETITPSGEHPGFRPGRTQASRDDDTLMEIDSKASTSNSSSYVHNAVSNKPPVLRPLTQKNQRSHVLTHVGQFFVNRAVKVEELRATDSTSERPEPSGKDEQPTSTLPPGVSSLSNTYAKLDSDVLSDSDQEMMIDYNSGSETPNRSTRTSPCKDSTSSNFGFYTQNKTAEQTSAIPSTSRTSPSHSFGFYSADQTPISVDETTVQPSRTSLVSQSSKSTEPNPAVVESIEKPTESASSCPDDKAVCGTPPIPQFSGFYSANPEVTEQSREEPTKKLVSFCTDDKMTCMPVPEDEIVPCCINIVGFAQHYPLLKEKDVKSFYELTHDIKSKLANALHRYFIHADGDNSLLYLKSFLNNKQILPHQLSKAICEILSERKVKLSEDSTGLMKFFTPVQKKAVLLVIDLANGSFAYFDQVLSVMELFLCSNPTDRNEILKGSASYTNVSSVYALLCRSQGFVLRAQSFMFDLIYSRHISYFSVIHKIISVIPKAMPCASPNIGPLTYTIAYLLMKQGIYRQIKDSELAQYGVTLLRKKLQFNYGYNFPNDLTRDHVIDELMNNFTTKGADKAVVLLCKSQGYKWSYTVVQRYFFPFLNQTMSSDEQDEYLIARYIKVLGEISRCFAISICTPFVKRTLDQLQEILKRKPSVLVTESVISALLHFQRLDRQRVTLILCNWTPHNGRISLATVKSVKRILASKSVDYWKALS